MLYLASQSPRRRQLLEQLGYRFECLSLTLPEVRAAGETPQDYVSRVAWEKAAAGLALCAGEAGAFVLGADTEVVLDDVVFGKPEDAASACAMLRHLSGRRHQVISAVWLLGAQCQWQALCRTEVQMAALDEAAIAAYVAQGECFGKAGGYAIQGRAAAFVAHLSGSYSGVMGLPLYETAGLLARAGLRPVRE